MNFSHELVIPNEGFPFKLFIFEGKDGNYFRDRHWHSCVEIFALLEGKITCLVNEQEYELQPGSFILINSNEVHALTATVKNTALVMQIPRELFAKYYSGEEFIWFSHSPKEQDSEIMNQLKNMYHELAEKPEAYELQVMSRFYSAMHLLVTKYRKVQVSEELIQANKNIVHLSRITTYIKENYASDLSLESLAALFSYSPTYISHMFRKYAQTTFKAYLQNLRLERAYPDLVRSTMSISEIAMKHGFAGSRAFASSFKKYYGVLPSDFRRTLKE